MTDETESPKPKGKPPATREDRLAARLRENLRKRKEQARQREQGE